MNVSGSVAAIEYQGASGFLQDDINMNDKMNMLPNNTVKNIVEVTMIFLIQKHN